MLHELSPDMIKVIKILQGHKVTPKNKECRRKFKKQQSTAHNSKNDSWTIAQYDKSHQNIAGTQSKYEKNKRVQTQVQNQSTTHNAKMLHELLPEKNEVFKKLWEFRNTGWLRRHKECKWKLKSNKVLRTTAKNDTWIIAEYDTSHQNIAGTQGNYEKTKNAEENAKATMYCAQQQKWYMNYCRIW